MEFLADFWHVILAAVLVLLTGILSGFGKIIAESAVRLVRGRAGSDDSEDALAAKLAKEQKKAEKKARKAELKREKKDMGQPLRDEEKQAS